MPYKSKAQMRKFHSDPALKKFAPEWDAATKGIKSLPDRVNAAKSASKKLKSRKQFAQIAEKLAQNKKFPAHIAQLAARVAHGQETASGEKAESSRLQKSEGARGERLESMSKKGRK